MFLNYLKDFSTKKIVKNNLSNVKHLTSEKVIKTVGIIFDETYKIINKPGIIFTA